MKTEVLWIGVLVALLGTDEAWAQYNLRTIPASPQAGAPFVVAFDGDSCSIWVLQSPGLPPSVETQGGTLRVSADLRTFAQCGGDILTSTVSVPALPAGNYSLELLARGVAVPGLGITVQTINFQVGQAVSFAPVTIPASHWWSLGVLGVLLLALARRR